MTSPSHGEDRRFNSGRAHHFSRLDSISSESFFNSFFHHVRCSKSSQKALFFSSWSLLQIITKSPLFFHGKNGQNSQISVKSVNTRHYMQKDGFPSVNVGGKERVTRALLGSTVVVADFLATVHIEIVFLLVGLWGVLTSAFGYCPFNTLMGRNSCVLPEASQKATS